MTTEPTTIGPDTPAQDVIDSVYAALVAQGAPSFSSSYTCHYRHEGLKCAVGICLTDDEYSPDMEGVQVNELGDLLPERLRPHTDTLYQLQMAHDAAAMMGGDFYDALLESMNELYVGPST